MSIVMKEACRDERTIMTYKKTIIILAFASICVLGCGTTANIQLAKADGTGFERKKMANTENTDPVQTPAVIDIKLESKILPGEQEITIKYTVTNTSGKDIYILDAYPAVDQATRTGYADLKSFYLSFHEPGTAFVLKGIPPLPSDKSVSVRVMPVGTKLGQTEKVSRELVLPLPLRERSDWYYTPLPPEEYSLNSIETIVFAVQFLRSTVEGFDAQPAHYAEGFFVVKGKNTVKQAETLKVEFTIGKTQIFVRKDRFNRF